MSVFGRNPAVSMKMQSKTCSQFKVILIISLFITLVTRFPSSNRKLINIGSSCSLERKDRVTIDVYYNFDAPRDNAELTFDIVSIGSQRRPDLMITQQNTWASHISVRSFWGLTEDDDGDINCALERNETVIKEYFKYCTTTKPGDSVTSKRLAGMHRPEQSIGWLCAQRRPGYALGKRGQAYRSDVLKYGDASLPDYLILVDDDTFINMELFNTFMKDKNPSIPMALSGCKFWAHRIGHFPWGGFGVILSRGSIELMIRPLNCDENNDVESKWGKYEALACSRIEENDLGEKDLFQPGMSISDLAYAIASKKYFCMHSDHLTGYLVNYYYLSDEAYRFQTVLEKKDCANNNQLWCNSSSYICHRLSKRFMADLSIDVMRKFPAMYRKSVDEMVKLIV